MQAADGTSTGPLLQYSGTLIHHAEPRTRVIGSVSVPVLCMDIELDNTLHNLMHVEQPFPVDHFKQAEAAAHRLKKGMRVTVQAQPLDLRLVACNVAHIHVINPTEETSDHA